MKKTYEKPIINTVMLNTEEITARPLLSTAYTIHTTEENTTKSWTTVSY